MHSYYYGFDSHVMASKPAVLYTHPSWYSFSSWPQSDITSLGHSATYTFFEALLALK